MINHNKNIMLQATNGVAVTPNDSTDIDFGSNDGCTLYVGGTGDIKVDLAGGQTLTFKAVPVGFFPVLIKRVHSTGTTATEIIALF